jgi:ComF family protein
MAEVIGRLVNYASPAVLVPVPLGRHRLRQRGYNQACAVAGSLGAMWKMPVIESILVRSRETKTQTELSPEERMRNVSGAFVATPPTSRSSIILIDDVLTTGATLVAAAEALAEAGWADVSAVTFARAMPLAVQLDRV